jgi:hypothetical protein
MGNARNVHPFLCVIDDVENARIAGADTPFAISAALFL